MTLQKTKIIILYIIFWLPIAFSQSLSVYRYSAKDGLPSNTITTILQDSKGYIWIGTYEGISRYDGASFNNYRKQEGLGGVVVVSALESRITPGRIIVGTINGGISRIANTNESYKITSSNYDIGSPSSIAENIDGSLWCVIDNAVVKLSKNKIIDTILVLPKGINAHLKTVENIIAVGVANKIHFYSSEEKDINDILLNPKSSVLKLYVDNEKNLWVTTTDSNLFEYHGNTLLGKCKLPAAAKDLVLDPDGFIWLASKSGLLKLSLDRWKNSRATLFGEKNGLPENNISCVFVDAEKNLWIGTWDKGLVRLIDKTALMFDIPGLIQIESLVVDNFGNAWYTTPGIGIWEFYKNSDGTWQNKLHKLNFPKAELSGQLICRGNNLLWVVLLDGSIEVFHINHIQGEQSKLQQITNIKFLPKGLMPYRIYIDHKQRLWCSVTDNYNIYVYDVSKFPKLLKTLKFPEDISVKAVRAIGSDHLGNIWLGGFSDGLERISPDWEKKLFTIHDGLPDNGIRAIKNDDRDRLWFGTRYGGIAVYDGTHFTKITTTQGLLSNVVWSLSYDGHSKMWVGSSLGAMWISTSDYSKKGWYASTVGNETFLCAAGSNQNLWARTADQIILCDYGKKTRNTVPPPVYISNITVNDIPIASQSFNEEPYDKNTWAFHFIGLSFRGANSVKFRYRLIGSTTKWSSPIQQRSVIFAELKPGNYRFEVKAINGDGLPSVNPAAFDFTILAPFWLSPWFIVSIILTLGSGAGFILFSRFKRLKKEEHRQSEFSRLLIELQEKERKRIASELHDGLGQNLLIIKNLAEMGNAGNTHDSKKFLEDISNIAGRSVTEVREIAHDLRPHLLDKLGLTKCLRSMVRQASESSSINISEMICQLENVFSPEKEINIYRILQECINNIIKHSDATSATISIDIENQKLIILVSDNGKGFLKNQNILPTSQSGEFGLITMEERVRLLKGEWSLLSEPNNGTHVKAIIPITKDIL